MCQDISDIVSRWLALELSPNGYYTNPIILPSNQIGTCLPRRPITIGLTATWHGSPTETGPRVVQSQIVEHWARRLSWPGLVTRWTFFTSLLSSQMIEADRFTTSQMIDGWSFSWVRGMITWWGWVRSLSSSGLPSWLVSCPPSSFSWKREERCYFKTGGRGRFADPQ